MKKTRFHFFKIILYLANNFQLVNSTSILDELLVLDSSNAINHRTIVSLLKGLSMIIRNYRRTNLKELK